jgi:cytochrome c5
VNKLRLLFVSSMVVYSLAVFAGPKEDAIAERIKRVGTVCVEGSDCIQSSGTATNTTVIAVVDSNGAESNYKKTCATCHAAGIAGAPKFADAAQWESRIAKGMDTLYTSSISGLPPGMPAKGMCFSCSDDDLKAIVDYMVEAAK